MTTRFCQVYACRGGTGVPAFAVLEKSSVAEWVWEESNRLNVWTKNRRAGLQMSDAAQGGRLHRQGSGREGAGSGGRGDWSDRSVHVSSSIHQTVTLWFNQTRNVLTRFDCKSTGECVVMQTPVPACAYWTKISSNQIKRDMSLIALSTFWPNVLFSN